MVMNQERYRRCIEELIIRFRLKSMIEETTEKLSQLPCSGRVNKKRIERDLLVVLLSEPQDKMTLEEQIVQFRLRSMTKEIAKKIDWVSCPKCLKTRSVKQIERVTKNAICSILYED